ncbi:MAG: hypothetical protein R2822_30830 [Spirosomataceae bacterium]
MFPSAALAWKLKEESFLKNVKGLTDLKLRLGYGITGQQDVGSDYPYLARYTLSDATAFYQFGNTLSQPFALKATMPISSGSKLKPSMQGLIMRS